MKNDDDMGKTMMDKNLARYLSKIRTVKAIVSKKSTYEDKECPSLYVDFLIVSVYLMMLWAKQ